MIADDIVKHAKCADLLLEEFLDSGRSKILSTDDFALLRDLQKRIHKVIELADKMTDKTPPELKEINEWNYLQSSP